MLTQHNELHFSFTHLPTHKYGIAGREKLENKYIGQGHAVSGIGLSYVSKVLCILLDVVNFIAICYADKSSSAALLTITRR